MVGVCARPCLPPLLVLCTSSTSRVGGCGAVCLRVWCCFSRCRSLGLDLQFLSVLPRAASPACLRLCICLYGLLVGLRNCTAHCKPRGREKLHGVLCDLCEGRRGCAVFALVSMACFREGGVPIRVIEVV